MTEQAKPPENNRYLVHEVDSERAPIGIALEGGAKGDEIKVATHGTWTAPTGDEGWHNIHARACQCLAYIQRARPELLEGPEGANMQMRGIQVFWDALGHAVSEVRLDARWVDVDENGGMKTVAECQTDPPPKFARLDDDTFGLTPEDQGRYHSSIYFEHQDDDWALGRAWFIFRYTGETPQRPGDQPVRLSSNLITTAKQLPRAGRVVAGDTFEGQKKTKLIREADNVAIVDESLKSSNRYLSLPIRCELEQGNELQSLLSQLPGLRKFSNSKRIQHFVEAPRVLVGMFAAAQEDEALEMPGFRPGTFWDKPNGIRLTHVCGMNRRSRAQKKRVATIRDWLSKIWFHAEYKKDGSTAVHRAPVVQKLQDTLKISGDQAGDLRGGTYHLWMLSKDLYDMTRYDSAIRYYISIDRGAFDLKRDDSFNLYLSMLNRAHQAHRTGSTKDKVTSAGLFRPKVWTLYRWAGMDRESDWPSRVRENMREALTEVLEADLITNWKCPLLESGGRITWEDIKSERVSLWLPGDVVRRLPSGAILEGDKR